MDEFKKYLQQQRDKMDVDTPPAQLLQRILQQTAVKKKNNLFTTVLRTAAAACTITIIAFSIKWMMKERDTKKQDIGIADKTKKLQVITGSLTDTASSNLIANITVADNKKQKNGFTKKPKQKKEAISYHLMHSFEQNYAQLVSLQLKSIRNTPLYGETQDYFNDFKKTLKQIDTDEAALKLNIRTNGLNDELLEQLINVYQQKINVLKDLQHEMNKMNRKLKENQLPSDTLKPSYINI